MRVGVRKWVDGLERGLKRWEFIGISHFLLFCWKSSRTMQFGPPPPNPRKQSLSSFYYSQPHKQPYLLQTPPQQPPPSYLPPTPTPTPTPHFSPTPHCITFSFSNLKMMQKYQMQLRVVWIRHYNKQVFSLMSLQQEKSAFHSYRSQYQPRTPRILKESVLDSVEVEAVIAPEIAAIFPHIFQKGVKALNFKRGEASDHIVNALRVGCVLSGGQAAGGHNVIVGIYDYIKRIHKNSQLFGFLNGPRGIFTGEYVEINDAHISYFKNRGGFDMICSGRDKIEEPEQFEKSLKYCESLKLDGLVVIGGDDSNTNAALLAEYFLAKGSGIRVVGCPKTIDGDLKNEFVEVSFGFDTACKTYSECIGSIMADTLSSKKYYHFIRLMGRSASHIALECSLLTRPTYAFIGQEVEAKRQTLQELVAKLVEIIVKRAQNGKNYGVVLIPQGLVEFIPQMNTLITEINKIVAGIKSTDSQELKGLIYDKLSEGSKKLFDFLPKEIANQLLLDRDPHGNVQVAKIETEKFIIDLVQQELRKNGFKGKFSPLANYFGYEGRCAFPTTFDCDYCYSLGLNAGAIIQAGLTGLMSCVRNLEREPQEWLPGGYPLVTMMNIENRKGRNVPVIKKALVELEGSLFKLYEQKREEWALGDFFNLVASAQYEFPEAKPYLAVPPSASELYFPKQNPQLSADETPFSLITNNNLNPLSAAIIKDTIEYPSILDGHPVPVFSQQLKFKTKQLKLSVEKEFPFLSERGHQIVTFTQSSQTVQPRKVRIGVSFNGRQSSGGHNIIYGLLAENSEVFGFIGGNKGLFTKKYIRITQKNIENYINQSGFHLLGRSSDKVRTQDEFHRSAETCQALDLDGLILIGATHTLTDGALLADYFLKNNIKTVVNCVPCTIDNNIHHKDLQISVGFATSSHTYSTLISNLMIDASSNTKYWYFIRLMGRDPSHLTLECALSTKPNYTIISEEVKHKGWDLEEIVNDIVRVIIRRQETGRNFGCILIPEGLPTFLPSFARIKTELDEIRAKDEHEALEKMSAWARDKFEKLPDFIKKQLFCRDDSNEFAVSQIETEKLLAYLVGERLKVLKKEKIYKGSFSSVSHFLGYQGRCAIPTSFDRNIAFTYGRIAKILVEKQLTGYCSSARGLVETPKNWFPVALPISHILEIKDKSKYGINKPIVQSNNVNLKSPSFKQFQKNREKWELIDHYSNPGPIQYFGPMKNYIPFTVSLEENYDFKVIEDINRKLTVLRGMSKFGADTLKLQLIQRNISNLLENLSLIENQFE